MEVDLSCSLKWDSRTYSLESFVDDRRSTFPRVVQVVEGFSTESEEDALANGQILVLHEVQEQQFVVATQPNGVELCIPRTCPIQVQLVPLDRLNDEYSTVEELFMAQPDYFRVVDAMPSFDIKAGSVMKICSRQNGVYHLECEAVNHAPYQKVVELPLDQRGQFQPLSDGRAYSLEEVVAKNSTLSEIGIRFIDTFIPGSMVSAETDTAVSLGKGFRLQREFQECTVVATSVIGGEDGQVLLFPKTLDVAIVPTLGCNEVIEGENTVLCRQSKISSCLERVVRLSARCAYSINSPVRTFSLECLTPPPLPKRRETGLSLQQAESHGHQNTNTRTATELPRQEDPAQDVTRTTDSPNPRADKMRKDNVDLGMNRANGCVDGKFSLRPRHEDRNQLSTEYVATNKCTTARQIDDIDSKIVQTNSSGIALPLLTKEDSNRGVSNVIFKRNKESNSEEQIPREESSVNEESDESRDKGSLSIAPKVRPIPKPRRMKKNASTTLPLSSFSQECTLAPPLPIKIRQYNNVNSSVSNSAFSTDPGIKTLKYDPKKKEPNPHNSDELPQHLEYINVASQNKVIEATEEQIIYHMSPGNAEPLLTVQRTRHHYHTETTTLSQRHPLALDGVVRIPATSEGAPAMTSDATSKTIRYVNESCFKCESSHWSHQLSDGVVTSSANLNRQGGLVSSRSPEPAPTYVNQSQRHPHTEMMGHVEVSKALTDPCVKYNPGSNLISNFSTDRMRKSNIPGHFELQMCSEWEGACSSLEDNKDLNDSRTVQQHNTLQLSHGDVTLIPEAEQATIVHISVDDTPCNTTSVSREVENCAISSKPSESSEDEEDSHLKVTLTDEDGYCAMDQSGYRETSDTYSYPYMLFPWMNLRTSIERPTKSQLQLLVEKSSDTADCEEGVPELPEKPVFLRQREACRRISQTDSTSVAPSLQPRAVVSPTRMRESSSAAGRKSDLARNGRDDEGAYLIVDVVDSLTPNVQHSACVQGKPSRALPPLPMRTTKMTEKDNSAMAYDGIYSIIPPLDSNHEAQNIKVHDDELYGQDYEEYDVCTTQASRPLQERIKLPSISLFTEKTKKKAKQRKRTEDNNKTEHCPDQAQIEHLPISSTYQRSDHRNEFEDINTLCLFLKMRDQQRELEAEISRQRSAFEAEIARQQTMPPRSIGQEAGLTDGTINQDSRAGARGRNVVNHTLTNGELPQTLSPGGREAWSTRGAPPSPQPSSESTANEARSFSQCRKQPVPKPRKRK